MVDSSATLEPFMIRLLLITFHSLRSGSLGFDCGLLGRMSFRHFVISLN